MRPNEPIKQKLLRKYEELVQAGKAAPLESFEARIEREVDEMIEQEAELTFIGTNDEAEDLNDEEQLDIIKDRLNKKNPILEKYLLELTDDEDEAHVPEERKVTKEEEILSPETIGTTTLNVATWNCNGKWFNHARNFIEL